MDALNAMHINKIGARETIGKSLPVPDAVLVSHQKVLHTLCLAQREKRIKVSASSQDWKEMCLALCLVSCTGMRSAKPIYSRCNLSFQSYLVFVNLGLNSLAFSDQTPDPIYRHIHTEECSMRSPYQSSNHQIGGQVHESCLRLMQALMLVNHLVHATTASEFHEADVRVEIAWSVHVRRSFTSRTGSMTLPAKCWDKQIEGCQCAGPRARESQRYAHCRAASHCHCRRAPSFTAK